MTTPATTSTTTMPLVQIHGADDVRVDQVPRPQVGPDDVLVRVVSCGICGSDLGYVAMGGLTPPGVPMPLGHELAGTVEQMGANTSGFKLGQKVTVNPMANNDAIGNGGPHGGFAPFLLVRNVTVAEDAVLTLPESISFDEGALIEPLAVAMHAVNQSGVEAGQSALVMGAGPIGLCTVLVLKYRGVENVVVADRSTHRLAVAQRLGATAVCNVENDDLALCLRSEHGEAHVMGAAVPATDVYYEATGVGQVLEQAIELACVGARIVVVGVHKAAIQVHPLTLLVKELRLSGSMAYTSEFPEVLAMLQSGLVDTGPLISHHYPLAEFSQALEMASDPGRAVKVMIAVG